MAIIIPEAQTPFSPVQQPRQSFDTPTPGAALQTVANTALNIAAGQQERERNNTMRSARVTAVEKLGQLRVQFEQDPNVSGLTDRFTAATDAAIEGIAESLPDDRMREDFKLGMRETRAPQSEAMARRQFALEGDAARAQTRQMLRSYVEQSVAAPDPESRAAILAQAASDIASLQSDGFIDAEQADAWLVDASENALMALAVRTQADDPEFFLQQKADGEFIGIDPTTLERMETAAKSAIASANATLAKQSDAAAIAADKALKSDIDDAVRIIESGQPFDGLSELQTRATDTPYASQLNATLAAAQTAGNFAVLSPVDMQAEIDKLESAPTKDPDDIARIDRLRTMRADTVKNLTSDPLLHVATRDILQIENVDIADAASVNWRINQAEAVAQMYPNGATAPQLRYFTNTERDTFQQTIATGAPETQLAMVANIVSNFGDRTPAVLAEIGADDPVFQLAGSLVWQTQSPAAARTILQGRQLAADGRGAKLDNATRGSARPEIAALFLPGSEARAATLMDAAEAHFAASGMMMNPDATPENKRAAFRKSLQAVTGQVVINGAAFGGIQSVNDQEVLLPPTANADVVSAALGSDDDAAWSAGSITGQPPYWGDKTVSQMLGSRSFNASRIKLKSIGGGQYLVGILRDDQEPRYFTDFASPDGLFRLQLDPFLDAVK